MREEISFSKIIDITLKLWWVVLIFAIIGSLVAYTVSTAFMTPMYRSIAKVYVSGSERQEGTNLNINDVNLSTRLVTTYIEILCGNEFLTEVAEDYNKKYGSGKSSMNAVAIKSNITMDSANDTEILEIEYKADSSEKANRVLSILLDKAQGEITRVMNGCKVSIVDNATIPLNPFSPNIRQNTFIGLVLGILLGVAVVLIRELLDTRINDDDDIKTRYKLPVLGIIPNIDTD